MSRSKRKTPVFGHTTAVSEKLDKRRWNKAFRRVSRSLMNEAEQLPVKTAAVSDVWSGNKDGKRYSTSATKRDMRK